MAEPTAEELRVALGELHDQTDEDCPSENRTRHLRSAMARASKLCRDYDRAQKSGTNKDEEE